MKWKVVREKGKKKSKTPGSPAERQLTAEDFSKRDVRMVIDDVHRTRSLIQRLMGSNVAPRKEWLMGVDWSQEE